MRPVYTEVKSLLGESAAEWNSHNAPRLGAALAFYTLLSIAPLLFVAAAMAGLVFGAKAARGEIIRQVYAVAGPAVADLVAAILNGNRSPAHGVIMTVVGFVILFFGASSVLIELREALNTMWDLPLKKRTAFQTATDIVRDRLFAFVVVLCIGIFLLGSLTVNAAVSLFANNALHLHVLASAVSFFVITGLFAAIYRFLPDLRLQWVDVLLGAVVTSLLFTAGRILIAWYLSAEDFGTTYGTAASTTVLLVWVYYSSQIFFFGAAFTKVFARRFGSRSH